MTFGNNNQGPVGVPPVGPNPLAGQVIGTGGAAYPPIYAPTGESVLAAASRGAISLNQQMPSNTQLGGNGAVGQQLGNPTLLQAITQGPSQNGTNGLNGTGAGGGTVNSSYASCNNTPGTLDSGFDSTATVDAKAMVNVSGLPTSNIQYGGN